MNNKLKNFLFIFFCALIAVIMILVLVHGYKPDHNTLGAFASVCMDAICTFIIITLILSLALENKDHSNSTKLFLGLMSGTMIGLFFDFLNWAYDGSLKFGEWTYIFTVCSLCMGSIVAILFVLYLGTYLSEMYKLKRAFKLGKIFAVINLISFVITFILALTKTAFNYTDGHYTTGALYDVVTVLPILTLLIMTGYVICHIKVIGVHDVWAVSGYIICMIIGALVESVYSIGTTYVGVAVADLFIFVMLQNKHLETEKRNVKKWIQKSNTDELTGFYNRHAYEEELNSFGVDKMKENFVYVSIDVNGLKLVNDSLGHEAGDELLLGAAECLQQCFGSYGKLFRTGGDEFAALIYTDEAQLEEIKKDIEEVFEHWSGKFSDNLTISCGYVSKTESDYLTIRQMASLADKRMYEAKNAYYQKKGFNRRGQRDAHVALIASYEKILKLSLTDDTYQVINSQMEPSEKNGYADKLSESISNYINSGLIHPDDIDMFKNLTDIDYMKDYYHSGNKLLRVVFRLMDQEVFKKCLLEIIPANDYTEENQYLYLYEKIIE